MGNSTVKMLTCIGLLLMMAFPSSARLSETEEQSKQRYGDPINKDVDRLNISPMIDGAVHHTYKYQGWRIRCAFVEGKAVRITYMKEGGKDVKPAIQDDELLAILEGEVGGGKWQKKSSMPGNLGEALLGSLVKGTEFINTNGNTARLEFGRLIVNFESPAAAVFIKARDEAKEQKRKATIPKF
jgi:hypothetical protein